MALVCRLALALGLLIVLTVLVVAARFYYAKRKSGYMPAMRSSSTADDCSVRSPTTIDLPEMCCEVPPKNHVAENTSNNHVTS